MKKLVLAVVITGLLMPELASAEDIHVPPWRGLPGSTYQQWTFDSNFGTTPIFPEVDNNPYGLAGIIVDDESTKWLSGYEGRDGILRVRDFESLYIDIPNHNCSPGGEDKEIWVQVIWHWDGYTGYEWDPSPKSWKGDELTKPMGDNWFYDWLWLDYEGCPGHERLIVTNDWEFLYVDEIIIETYCVPEPASLALLAIGGLTVLRRRR